MAHEVENMMYVGDVPWHKLGHQFIEPPSLEDAIVAAGLDWTVTTEPGFTQAGEQAPCLITRRSSDRRILGVTGPAYKPLQNKEAFEFFRPFIEANEAAIETAGSLRQGQRVFVLCKINRDPMVIKGEDTVQKYVLLSNSHDGSLAVRVGFTPIRVVCANTLAMSHDSKASKLIRVRHTKNVVETLEKIREVMDVANSEFEATAEQYRLLATREINQKDLEKYVKLVFCKKAVNEQPIEEVTQGSRIFEKIIPLFEKGRGNDLPGVKGTLWAAYNATTEYLQYERGDDEATRLEQAWFGQGFSLNKRALDVAVNIAQMAA